MFEIASAHKVKIVCALGITLLDHVDVIRKYFDRQVLLEIRVGSIHDTSKMWKDETEAIRFAKKSYSISLFIISIAATKCTMHGFHIGAGELSSKRPRC